MCEIGSKIWRRKRHYRSQTRRCEDGEGEARKAADRRVNDGNAEKKKKKQRSWKLPVRKEETEDEL
jgi:hypothetical protein